MPNTCFRFENMKKKILQSEKESRSNREILV